MTEVMTSNNGIYTTEYASEKITVRLFEAPELMVSPNDQSVWQAVVTYAGEVAGTPGNKKTFRQDLDTLTIEQRDYCRKCAIELQKKDGVEPFGDLHKGYMAKVYWGLIK